MIHRRALLQTGLAGLLLAERRAFGVADSKTGLIVHSRVPHNAEPPLDALIQSWITPNELFYVRSHAPVPDIDVATFRLSVEGMVHRPFEITLAQLQRDHRKHTVTATMSCAGNRRNEHSLIRPVSGVPWGPGAVGNAEWGGTSLSALLKKAGVQEGAKHVWFEGADQIERSQGVIPFGASIPIQKALDPGGSQPGALVVYEMNGEPLSPDHGFPMRTVVPGFIGARSVKWLRKIVVSDRPSSNHYVANAYKLVTEGTEEEWSEASPIETLVVNSVICRPRPGAQVDAGSLHVSGYALPSGQAGRTVRRVEISTDSGKTWTAARLTAPSRPFCWQLWEAAVPVTPGATHLLARAVDSAGTAQPEKVAWNLKGYLYNAYHKVPLVVR